MKSSKITPGSNLMWEGSRMMLPEHVELLRQHQKDFEKVDKPVIDEQRRAEMDELVCEAMAYVQPLQFTYYDKGMLKKIAGKIARYDEHGKTLWIRHETEGVVKLGMENIVDVEEA